MTFRRYLFSVLGAAVIAPLLVTGFVVWQIISDRLERLADSVLSAQARQSAQPFSALLLNGIALARSASQMPIMEEYLSARPKDRAGLEEELARTMAGLAGGEVGRQFSCALLDLEGTDVMDSDAALRGNDESKTACFLEPRRTGEAYCGAELDRVRGTATFCAGAPVRGKGGEVMGVIRVRATGSPLQGMAVAEQSVLPSGTQVALVGPDNGFLAHGRRPDLVGKATKMPLRAGLPGKVSIQTGQGAGVEGERVAVVGLPEAGWRLMVVQSSASARSLEQPITVGFMALGVATVLLTLLAATLASRRIGRSILRVVGATRNLASGNLDARVALSGLEELSMLGRAFNSMTEDLRKTFGDLYQNRQELRMRVEELEKEVQAARGAEQGKQAPAQTVPAGASGAKPGTAPQARSNGSL